MREHQRANPQQNRDRVTVWRLDNPDKQHVYYQKFQREHPLAIAASDANGKARRFGIKGEITEQQLINLFAAQKNKCLRCGKKRKLTVDHVEPFMIGPRHNAKFNPACTNTIANIQGLCRGCNSAKGPSAIDYRRACRNCAEAA